jgi:hypothetical protein
MVFDALDREVDAAHKLGVATQAQLCARLRFEDMRAAGYAALLQPTRV